MTPASGGTLELQSTTATTVEFPAGAVDQDTEATIRTSANVTGDQQGVGFLGDAVEVGLNETTALAHLSLAKPVAVAIDYEEKDVPGGVKEEDLAIYRLDNNDSWIIFILDG